MSEPIHSYLPTFTRGDKVTSIKNTDCVYEVLYQHGGVTGTKLLTLNGKPQPGFQYEGRTALLRRV